MENTIKITHFVNPHQFWFTRSEPCFMGKLELLCHEALNKYYTSHYDAEKTGPDGYYEPVTGEIVAGYDPARKNWTRNRVVDATHVGDKNIVRHTYQVWSLDEGVSKEAAAEHVKPLPSNFSNSNNVSVKQGSLRMIPPTIHFYNHDEGLFYEKAATEWDSSIITELQVLMQYAEKTYFRNTTTRIIAGEEIEFGDLWFLTKQQKLIAATDIVSQMRAQIVDEERLLELMTLNRKPANTHIPAKVEKQDTNVSVAVDPKETLEHAAVSTKSLPTSVPHSQTDSTDTATNEPRIISAQLECVSSEQHAANPVSEKTLTGLQRMLARLRLEIDAQTVVSPLRTTSLTTNESILSTSEDAAGGNLNLAGGNKSSLSTSGSVPDSRAAPEPCHQPAEHTTALQRKLARLMRDTKLTKTDAVNSTTIEAEAVESSLNTTRSTSNEQMPSNKLVPLTIHPIGNIRSLVRLLKEEQSVASQHRILVHGETIPNPIDSVAEANFCPSVHQVLTHCGIRMANRLQSYAWPLIMQGNSLLCVSSPGTGKTFVHLPAVCSLVKMNIEASLGMPDAGPIGIIVCSSSMEVQRIGNLCRRMVKADRNEQMSVIECYGMQSVTRVCNKLLSGCALLVTTAPAYRRLYKAMPEVFVCKRIRMVVIDNIDQMLQNCAAALQLLFKNCNGADLQIIITADSWDRKLGNVPQRYKNMITCIGTYLEAAVYAKVQLQLRILRNDGSKQHELVQYIREHDYRTQRTIVFAGSTDDLNLIVETLRQHSIQHLVCSASTTVNQRDGFRYWDELLPGAMEVLICLDELFSDLYVSKAQHIVHYSLPHSWTLFTRRFAACFNYDEFPYQKLNSDESPKAVPSTLVLVDEKHNQQHPKLIDFLKLHHVQFPEELSVLAQNIANATEYERIFNGRAASALCPQLLALANCRSFPSCAYRHTLVESDLDLGDCLPSIGTVVRLRILHVFSPVHFVVHLDTHRADSAGSCWTQLSSRSKFILHDIKLQAHFANPERHQKYGKKVMQNDLCALLHEHEYWRCRIVHVKAEGKTATVDDVQLKLIDSGRIVNTKVTNLLYLPEKFHELPNQAIEVRVAGVVPPDLEEDWNHHSTKRVQRWIENHAEESHHYFEGKVLFALRDMIWIEELMFTEQLDSMKTVVVATKLKSSIVSDQLGVYDRGSFERMQQIVQNFQAAHTVDGLAEQKSVANIQTPIASKLEDKSNTINDQDELVVERSRSVATNKQEDVVRDIRSHEITNPSPTRSGRQTPLEGGHSQANISIRSTSLVELLSPTPDKEKYRFAALEMGREYTVIIARYFSPDLFYVYQIDEMIQINKQIKAYVENSNNTEKLTHLEVGVYCLVYFEDTYRRSQIMEVTEETIKVFLLDFGGTIWCYREELLTIPDYLLRDYPFAAIEGKLAYVEPLEGSTWTDQVSDAIYDDVLEKYNERGMVAVALHTLGPRHEADAADQSVEGCHRYELVLSNVDIEDQWSIISELAQKKLVMVCYKTDSDPEDEEYNPYGDFAHAVTAAIEQKNATPMGTGCFSSNQILREKSTDTSKYIAAAGHESNLSRLECDYRIPQTEWWQDDVFITLYVSAPDVAHYQLTVRAKSVLLQFIRDDLPYQLALNLFGPIDPEHTTHEVRGLSIVIRLARLPGTTWLWPFLINHNAKLPYLKKVMGPPRHRRTSSDGWSESESSDVAEFELTNLLPTRDDDTFYTDSSEAEESDDLQEDLNITMI